MSSRRSGKPSARDARYQKRRATIVMGSRAMPKGTQNKEDPIAISSSDDEKDAKGGGLTAGASKRKDSTESDQKSDHEQRVHDSPAVSLKPDSEDKVEAEVMIEGKDQKHDPQRAPSSGVIEDDLSRSGAGAGGHRRDSSAHEGDEEYVAKEEGREGNEAGDNSPSGGEERDHGDDDSGGGDGDSEDADDDSGDRDEKTGDGVSNSDNDEGKNNGTTSNEEEEKGDGGVEVTVDVVDTADVESHQAGGVESFAGAEAGPPLVPVSNAHSDSPTAAAGDITAFLISQDSLEPEASNVQVDAMEVDDDDVADKIPQCTRQEVPGKEPTFQDSSGGAVSCWAAEAEGDTVEEVDSEEGYEVNEQEHPGPNRDAAEEVAHTQTEASSFRLIQGEDDVKGQTRPDGEGDSGSETEVGSLTKRNLGTVGMETENQDCGKGATSDGVVELEDGVEDERTDAADLLDTAEVETADAPREGKIEEQGFEDSQDMAECDVHEGDQNNGAGMASEEGEKDKGYGEGMKEEGYDKGGQRLDDGTDKDGRMDDTGMASEEEQDNKGYDEGAEEEGYAEESEMVDDDAPEEDSRDETGTAGDEGYGEVVREESYDEERHKSGDETDKDDKMDETGRTSEEEQEDEGLGEGMEEEVYAEEGEMVGDEVQEKGERGDAGRASDEEQDDEGYDEGAEEDQYDYEESDNPADEEDGQDETGRAWEEEQEKLYVEGEEIGGADEGRKNEADVSWEEVEEEETIDDGVVEGGRPNEVCEAFDEERNDEGYENCVEEEEEIDDEGEGMDEGDPRNEASRTWEEMEYNEGDGEEEGNAKEIGDGATGDTKDAAIDLVDSDEESPMAQVTHEATMLDEGEWIDRNSTLYGGDSTATATPTDEGPIETSLEDVANGTADGGVQEDRMERPEAVDDLEDPEDGAVTADGTSPDIADAPATDVSAVKGTPTSRAMNADTNGTVAPIGADTDPQPMDDRACRRVSFSVVQATSQQLKSTMHKNRDDSTKSTVNINPRDGMEEFEALLKGFSADDEREVLKFLADPTVRPVDPSLPILTAEQDKRLSTATSSPSDWDVDLILKLNPFLEQARQFMCVRGSERYKAKISSKPDWPSIGHVVPAMRRRNLSPKTSFRPVRPYAAGKGLAGSAFSLARHGRDGIVGVKRPAFDEHTDRSDDKVITKRARRDVRDDWLGSIRPPVPGFSTSPAVPAPSRSVAAILQPDGGTQTVQQAFRGRPRIDGRRNTIGVRLPSWQNSVTKPINRYRPLDFTPRRRPRSSFSGPNRRDDSLQKWLDGVPSDADSGVGADGASGGVSCKGMANGGSGNVLGVERAQGFRGSIAGHSRNCGEDATVAAPSNGKRSEGSLPGLQSVASSSALKRTVEETEKRVARVSAETKASAEVGNILLSMVSQGGDMSIQKKPETKAVEQRSEGQGELPTNQILVLQQHDGTKLTGDILSSAEDNGGRSEEFGFPDLSPRRLSAGSPRFASRSKRFSFTRCIPAKRSRTTADEGAESVSDYDTLRSPYDSPGVFEFATSESTSSRRTRRRVTISSASSMTPRVSGGYFSDSTSVMGSRGDLSTSSEVPAVKGFDMSLFKKPGEWKCDACLVRNPPGRDACLSCETPKPVVGQGGDPAYSGATAVAPIAPSTIGGALFAGKAPSSNQTFTFGVKPAGIWGSSGHNASVSSGPPSVQRGFVFGASAK